MVRCGSKNEHHKDKCGKEIGLHAQNLLTIRGVIFNILKRTYMTIK